MAYRIAMVGACPFPVPQGSQALLGDTARALAKRGHEVHLVVYGYGADISLPRDLDGVHIHRCLNLPGAGRIKAGPSMAKPFLDAALTLTLRRVLASTRADLVHAHNYEGLLVALAAGKRPIIYHAHNAMDDELPHYFPAAQAGARRAGAWLDRTFPRRADHAIVLHARLEKYLVECGCDAARVSVIPPPCDALALEPGLVRENLPPVLYLGNLDAYQNLPLLLDAMQHVRRAVTGARLVIATSDSGGVPEAEMVRVKDFDALRSLLCMDAVVACPRVSWSGYPIKILNAMGAGKAVVACAGAAPPIQDGHNGLLVSVNTPEKFADALISLLTHPELRAELGRNARSTMEARHRPEQIAEAIERVYERARGHA